MPGGAQGAAEPLLETIWYAAAVAVIGGAGAYLTATRWARRDRGLREAYAAIGLVLRRWALGAAAALVLLALVRVALRAGADAGGMASIDEMSRVVSTTAWGTGWWAQLYVALLALAGLLIAGRRQRQGWSLATAAALGVAYTLPMTGRDGAAVLERLPLALTALHVFGVGVAIGVPLVLLAAGRSGVVPGGLVAAAKWTLGLGVALALATGAAVAALRFGSVAALVESGAGRMVLVKLAAGTALAGLALTHPRAALAAAAAALLATALI